MCVCIAQVKSDSQAKVLCMTTIGILKLRAGQMDEVQVRSEVIEVESFPSSYLKYSAKNPPPFNEA